MKAAKPSPKLSADKRGTLITICGTKNPNAPKNHAPTIPCLLFFNANRSNTINGKNIEINNVTPIAAILLLLTIPVITKILRNCSVPSSYNPSFLNT